MDNQTAVKLSAIWGIILLLAVMAATGKLDPSMAALGITVIAGLAGYQVYMARKDQQEKEG